MIRALAWVYVAIGAIGLAIGCFLLIGLWFSPHDNTRTTAIGFVGWIFGSVAIVFLIPSLIGGIGVLKGQPWGRIVIIVMSLGMVLFVPIGTILGGLGLWAFAIKDPAPYRHRYMIGGVGLVAIVLVASWYIAQRTINGTPRPVADTLFVLVAAGTLIALVGSVILKRRRHAAPTLTRSPMVSPSPRAVPATSRAAERTLGSAITALSISPRDQIAVVAAKEVAIVNLDRLDVVRVLPHHGVIRAIAWSPDGARFATGRGVLWTEGQAEAGDSIFIWDAATGQPVSRIHGEGFGVRGLAFSPDGRQLIASSMHGVAAADGSSVDLFDVASGARTARLGHFVATQRRFTAVAFTPDGTHALAGTDRGIRLWRVSDGAEVDVAPVDAWITALSVTSDGTRVFAAGGVVTMRTLPTNAAVWQFASARDHIAAASADGRSVARGVGEQVDNHGPYEGTAIEIYDGASGALVSSGFHPTTIEAIVYDPSGRSVLSGGVAGELVLWSI